MINSFFNSVQFSIYLFYLFIQLFNYYLYFVFFLPSPSSFDYFASTRSLFSFLLPFFFFKLQSPILFFIESFFYSYSSSSTNNRKKKEGPFLNFYFLVFVFFLFSFPTIHFYFTSISILSPPHWFCLHLFWFYVFISPQNLPIESSYVSRIAWFRHECNKRQ